MNQPIPQLGQTVIHTDAEGNKRSAIVAHVWSALCVNLHVIGRDGSDPVCGSHTSVTHADPQQEPGCKPSWDYTEDDKALHKMQAEQLSGELVAYNGDQVEAAKLHVAAGIIHDQASDHPLHPIAVAFLKKQLAV